MLFPTSPRFCMLKEALKSSQSRILLSIICSCVGYSDGQIYLIVVWTTKYVFVKIRFTILLAYFVFLFVDELTEKLSHVFRHVRNISLQQKTVYSIVKKNIHQIVNFCSHIYSFVSKYQVYSTYYTFLLINVAKNDAERAAAP